jgi:very-short-patch-repair endonuclease/dihydroneopterin aldolase
MLEEAPVVTKAIFTDADWSILKNEVNNVIEVGRSCTEKRSNLKNTYNDSVFLLDLPGLIEISRSMGNVWFLKRWYLRALIRKIVQSVRKDHKKPKHLEIAERDLDEALSVVENIKYFEKKMSTMSRLLTPYWNGLDSNWDDLKRIVDYLDRFHAILNCAPGSDVDAKIKTRKSWISIITEGRSIFLKGSSIGQKGQLYRDSLFEYLKHVDLLNETMKLDLTVAWGTEDDAKFLKRAETTLTNLSKNLSRLREWTHYQSSRADIIKQNLMELALALELGEINEQQLNETFENSFADWWVRKVLKNISSLAGFIGEKHEFKIHEFRDHEARAAELIRKDIYDRIASALPLKAVSNQRSLSSSEVGILHRFSQGGRKTIRRMFLECPNSLSKYKPCVLMSPLSVAQFIGVDFPKFDVVVFDEASQIPTYEAIGAIARGNQLIVVGDSRQLPPTTFFERQKSDEEDIEDSLPEELESILDESEAAGIKHIRLDWHYRSRHESLIAFSNREFYDNRLFTFPTAVMKHPDLGVHWREITDGVYDYSKSRTNENEAKAVVEEVVRRLRNKEEAKYSLGVVTFSIAQQRLIENMLDEARSKYAEIDPYFTAVEEPVFIKNLETVQGDERDVILFSICYGPDITGTVRMNFGPLNNKGGERRLNVAITRARKQLLVFSKLKPEDIDLSRTKATGVKSLKAFLDYARRGTISVEAESTKTKGIETAPLELSIMNELAKRGYKVDKQVGCSDYRIDLAICDPKDTDSYILGIECDGLNYSNAKSARDREVIRKNILEGLGWNLHRVWSTEWWLRRPVEISKIEEALAKAKSRNSIIYNDLKKSNKTTAVAVDTMEMDVRNSVRNIVSKEINKDPEAANECDSGQSIYHKYKLQGRAYSGEIHDVDNYRRVCDLVKSIVEYESPILLDTLATRVTNCWGLQKTGSRIREVISHAVKHHKYILRHYDDRSFIWTKNLAEKPYEIFRIPEINDAKPRQAIEICPEEMANAAIHVLSLHISIGYEDLAREAAILFNIHRLGSNVRSYFEMGIDLMKKKGVCRVEGDRFILL